MKNNRNAQAIIGSLLTVLAITAALLLFLGALGKLWATPPTTPTADSSTVTVNGMHQITFPPDFATTNGLLQATNNLRGVASPNAAAQNLGIPSLLGPSNHTFILMGDSLQVGAVGLDPTHSVAANVQTWGLGAGGALMYALAFSGETSSEILGHWNGGSAVTTTITTTAGSVTATVGSASGISNGMCIGAVGIPPNTTLTISGTTVTLSNKATAAETSVTCSIATAPIGIHFGGLYPGGRANNWASFNGTAHMLSPAITGIPGDLYFAGGKNDVNEAATSTITCSTVTGSPNVTVTSGSPPTFVFGLVFTGTPFSSTAPPYISTVTDSTHVILSNPDGTPANATSTGSVTITVHSPVTALAALLTTFASVVTTAHTDGYTVTFATVLPSGNDPGQGSAVGKTFTAVVNAKIKANAFGADHICDTAASLPQTILAGNPLYESTLLHPNAQGCALEAQFIARFYSLQSLIQANYTPFGVGQLPDAWHSSNIPRINQATTIPGGWQFGSNGSNGSVFLPVYSEIDIYGSAVGGSGVAFSANARLLLQHAAGGSDVIQTNEQDGTSDGTWIVDSSGMSWSLPGTGNSIAVTSAGNVTFGHSGGSIITSTSSTWTINTASGTGTLTVNALPTFNLGSSGTLTMAWNNGGAWNYGWSRDGGDGSLVSQGNQSGNAGFKIKDSSGNILFFTGLTAGNAITAIGRIEATEGVANATATVSNTVTETTLVPAITGNVTIPASTLTVGAHYRVRARGIINNTGVPTLEIKAYLGSTAIADTTAITTVAVSGNNLWSFDDEFTCQSTGSSGTVYAQGQFSYFSAATTSNVAQAGNASATTINTTTSQAFSLRATWGTASSSNSITCTNLTFERIY